MTSASFSETSVSREPKADNNDSEHGSEHELSANDESPPSKTANKRERPCDDSDKDEPETKSAREDLRQTRISDREKSNTPELKNTMGNAEIRGDEDKNMEEPLAVKTPEPQSPKDRDEEMRDRQSPKKKRPRDREDDVDADVPSSALNGKKAVNGSSMDRSALPLKKRHRDASQDGTSGDKKPAEPKETTSIDDTKTTKPTESPKKAEAPTTAPPQTSTSAFASSGFAALASAPSPFAAVAASKPSVFGGSAAQKPSGFGALGSSKESTPPVSGFGSLTSTPAAGFGGLATTTGGFGGLSGGFSGGFGSGFTSGFGSGSKLMSFAAPSTKVDVTDTNSPAKKERAFGAPEGSDGEESDEGSDAEAAGNDDEDQPAEEKKKSKAPRAPILDGEEDEETQCQVRAKLFVISDKGWKERGVGTLKINIPLSHSTKYDDEDEEAGLISIEVKDNDKGKSVEKAEEIKPDAKGPYSARLIMRQDSTHRVILNSVILKDQSFQEKSLNTAIGILFTAFEDGKPINMQLKMNPQNATQFLKAIDEVKVRL